MLDRFRHTVLIVEEDQQLRKLICVILDNAGYRVLQARNSQQAVRLVEGEMPVDLVVFGGPSRGGAALAERTLLLSPDPADPPSGPVLKKPFKPAALVQAVRALID
ncbi:MAG: hypothetical protein ACM336_17735 [Acidobacteriota bacterium]